MHDDMISKTAVITGGSRGIGFGLTKRFVESGYRVVVGARTPTEFPTEIAASVRFVEGDVRSFEVHQALVDQAIEWSGRLDVYVNNAGYSQWRPIEEIDDEFFDNMVATNLKGAFWGCRAAASVMKTGGAIVNMSSIAAKRGTANNAMYCATKFGMNGLTQALAKELGPRGIRVNGVCPVLVRTEGLVQALGEKNAPAPGDVDGFLSRFSLQNTALQRLPTAEEVADMCLYLASDAASAVTGQSINVDCGVLPQ